MGIAVMLKASEDPLPEFLRDTWVGASLEQFPTGNQILYDLSAGFLVSVIFYVLVVRLPERAKRDRVKRHLLRQYDDLKEGLIVRLLWLSEGGADMELTRHLMDLSEFRHFYKQRVKDGHQTLWNFVENKLDDDAIRGMLLELELFRSEIDFSMAVLGIESDEHIRFARGLLQILGRSRSWNSGYDDVNRLSGLLWGLLSGWDPVQGYVAEDPVRAFILKL